ncbi:hypothetical protein DP55_795 [Burkholderia pseudomallei]|nr:hypothetical protein DP55_795 [Burkholderia pseudomallei]
MLLARWLFSMSLMGYRASLSAMASSPWACINVVLIFLLLVLPGAQARAERPLHPLPQWLRQALRFFALLGFLFAAWSVGVFAWAAGWRRALHALTVSNGWLLAAPALYAAVVWVCRPRALWRTNVAARRYAIGRYAVSLDMLTRTVVVWMESRKVGQYDARELSVRWPKGAEPRAASVEADAPAADAAGGAAASAATSDVAAADAAAAAGVRCAACAAGCRRARRRACRRARFGETAGGRAPRAARRRLVCPAEDRAAVGFAGRGRPQPPDRDARAARDGRGPRRGARARRVAQADRMTPAGRPAPPRSLRRHKEERC